MLKSYLARAFPKGSEIYNVSLLTGGAAIGQLVLILVLPILTRLYTPSDFGILAVYASILGIISAVASFRYEIAIPLPRTHGSAINVVVLCILCVLFTTTWVAGVTYFYFDQIAVWFNTAASTSFIWLLPVGVFLTGIYQVLNYWAIRQQKFGRIAKIKLQQGLIGAIVPLGFGLLHLGPVGLILGSMLEKSAGVIKLIQAANKEDAKYLSRINWSRVKQKARRYQGFPKFSTLASLANSGSTLLPAVLFAALFSPEVAGVYLLAKRVVQAPLSLLCSSVGQVFHSKAALSLQDGVLGTALIRASSGLIKVLLPTLIIIACFAQDFFTIFFGESWTKSGVYVQWMLPWLFVQFMVSPLSVIVGLTNNQRGGLISQVLFFLIRVSAIYFGAAAGGSDGAIFYYSMSGVIVYSGFWLWMLHIVGVSFLDWLAFLRRDLWLMKIVSCSFLFLMAFVTLGVGDNNEI